MKKSPSIASMETLDSMGSCEYEKKSYNKKKKEDDDFFKQLEAESDVSDIDDEIEVIDNKKYQDNQNPLAVAPLAVAPMAAAVAPTIMPVMTGAGGGQQQEKKYPPGFCTVCRCGRIKDSPSGCTWFWVVTCFPLFIVPSCIVFYSCCRHPKCNNCGYVVKY